MIALKQAEALHRRAICSPDRLPVRPTRILRRRCEPLAREVARSHEAAALGVLAVGAANVQHRFPNCECHFEPVDPVLVMDPTACLSCPCQEREVAGTVRQHGQTGQQFLCDLVGRRLKTERVHRAALERIGLHPGRNEMLK